MSILDNFDVVGVPRTFSIAEVRILKNRISFNLATASEIGYPPFVRLFISRDKTQIALQPCAKETPNAMKFFTSDSTKDGKPKKRMIPVGNRALTALVKAGIGVEMNVPLKAPGVRFADEGVIIFDLKQATDMNQPNACTETGLCLIPTPAYPFVEMPSVFGDRMGEVLFHNTLAGNFICQLSWLCPLLYVTSLLNSILHGLGNARQVLFVTLLACMIRICMILFLVPQYGIDAYLWGMLLSYVFAAIADILLLMPYSRAG